MTITERAQAAVETSRQAESDRKTADEISRQQTNLTYLCKRLRETLDIPADEADVEWIESNGARVSTLVIDGLRFTYFTHELRLVFNDGSDQTRIWSFSQPIDGLLGLGYALESRQREVDRREVQRKAQAERDAAHEARMAERKRVAGEPGEQDDPFSE